MMRHGFKLLFVITLGVETKPLLASEIFIEAFQRLLEAVRQRCY
jgi:hypothetical protein